MSFFGGGSAKKEDKDPPVAISKVGGFVDGLVWTLLQSLNDKKDAVGETVHRSLKDIGDQHPELVVSSCVNFMQTDTKASNAHRILVLKVIKAVVDDNRARIGKPLAQATINMAFAEMTESKEIKSEWQTAASDVLVTLGISHGPYVLEWVLKRMTPNEIPHYFVIKTLGDLAVADPVHVVPNIREVFGRFVALLNSIKHDNVRWVFSFVIGKFCESIIFFLANAKPQEIQAANINKMSYAGEVFTAYQIMFDNWLQRSEPSLRLVIMQAIGHMAETMTRDQFEAQLPKIITGILGMYKKEKKFLPITQGLSLVLDVAVQDGSRVLDPLLPVVLQTLHQLVCLGPDASADISSMKNYSELLRCFEILCKGFSDNIISFLLARFESKDERVRIGTLNIIKHIVNSAQSTLDDKKEMIISGLRPLLPETNLKVRKAFAQVVITLGSHEYLGLEGGQLLVEFIVRQCAPTKDEEDKYNKLPKKEPDAVSPTALKTMCDNVLNLLTTTIPAMEKVLWPYLLETTVPALYTDALSVVCKSLGHIASKKRTAEDAEYMIDFDRMVNLPKPQAIISRLLVILSRPNERPQLGENILTFFKAMGPVLHPSISDLWDEVVPKLATYLKDKSNDPALWVQSKWEDLIIKLLAKTVEEVNDDEWNIQLGEEMCKQFALYAGYPQQKSMLFKCLGVVLQKSQKKAFVREKLDYMFNMVDHNVAEDRDGCAVGYGACASAHLDIVLDKLQTVINADMKKKSSGFFGFSDKSDNDIDRIKCTVLLCYGHASAKADVSLIKSRIEVTVLSNVMPFFASAKPALVKECIIKCVDLLAKTMHPSHLQLDYVCTKRKELLQTMVRFVTTTAKGEFTTEVLTGAVNTAATLTLLNPILPTDEEAEVFSKTVGVIMRMPAAEASTADAMIGGLELIVQALFEKKCNSTVLDRLLKYHTAYVSDTDPVKRLRALNLLSIILQCFIDTAGANEGEKEKNVDNVDLMRWVATIVPRCTDSQENIRALAVSCASQLLVIKGMLATVSETLAQKMAVIGERITVTDTNAQFGIVNELSKSLAPELTSSELFPFVQVLLQGLADKEVTSASGTCIVLNGILRLRGGELAGQVPDIVTGIHSALKGITNEQTLNGALHSLRTLTGHHLVLVADQFLQMPLPHDDQAVKALKTLAADAKIGPLLNKHYLDLLATSQPYIEKPKSNKKDYTKEATKTTMAVTCSLGEMFVVPEMEEVVRAVLPTMMGSLLLRIGATNGIEKANADGRDCNKDAVTAFKHLLSCIKDEEVLAFLNKDKNDERFGKPDFYNALMELGGLVFDNYGEFMKDTVVFLSPFMNTNFDTQRITVAALFAEFIRHCKDQADLLSLMINPLIFRMGDTVQTMKLLVLEGLANVAEAGDAEVNKYSTTILSALMNGMEDATASPEMTKAALDGLSKIMAVVDPNNVVAILVNICLKLRGYFETPNTEIRASAITLFGALSRFGEGPCKAMFYEQIQTNMVTMLLHLNDTDAGVRKATKKTLKQLGPLLQADEINELLQTLAEDKSLLYGEFLHALCKRLVHYYGKQVNMYLMDGVNFFKSQWAENRGNAAMFIGFLLGQIPKEMRRSVNVDHVCNALMTLIKDDDEKVRLRVAESMALLYDY